MKRIALIGLLALAACAPAPKGNNVAEQVFEQTSALLLEQYYGFSLEQLPTVLAAGKNDLSKACSSLGSACGAEVAYPIINKMLDQLEDPHTFFENPTQFTESQRARSGQGGSFPVLGIVSVYRTNSNGRLITDVLPSMAAESVGLTRGDMIVALNGKPLPVGDDQSSLALRDEVRSGREFNLTVRRAGQNREIKAMGKLATVPRLPSVRKWAGVPSSVAVIRIPDYVPPQVADQTHKLINQAIKNGAKSIVLDLRSNSGGAATNCLSVAGAFMGRNGVIFEGKTKRDQYVYNNGVVTGSTGARASVSEPANFTGNVAVLVDKQSASCAEITPALLQSAKRATIIGEQTYGILNTGTLTFPVLDGSGLTITTVRTLDLNGKALPPRVTPNFVQPEDYDALETSARDIMLEKAVRVVQGLDTVFTSKPLPSPLSFVNLLELQPTLN
jgi:carboxyl-terminal processing protease